MTGDSHDNGEDRVPEGALFILPRSPGGQPGQIGIWTMAAGWADGARALWGTSWLLTLNGPMSPSSAVERAAGSQGSKSASPSWKRLVPTVAKTGIKDVRDFFRARRFTRSLPGGEWESCELAFVWQRHDLFHDAGHRLARQLGVPLVLCVDAPVVWEARRWGVRRPGWSSAIEALGENPLFRQADLVAAVSQEVAEEVTRRGVPSARVVVTPNGVDLERFTPAVDATWVRDRYGLDGRFVVGWAGGFHKFHSLDTAIDLAESLGDSIPGLVLFLVGDGIERARLEAEARRRDLTNVVFTGSVDHSEMPAHIGAMDVALVLGPGDGRFHYSPLKLREYMACGVPVVAPRVGEMASNVADGETGVLIGSGDLGSLVDAVRRLHDDPGLRTRIGEGGRSKMMQEGSWENQVRKVYQRLLELRDMAPVAIDLNPGAVGDD